MAQWPLQACIDVTTVETMSLTASSGAGVVVELTSADTADTDRLAVITYSAR